MKIILGSKSPRRKEILQMVTNDFSVRVSEADESYGNDIPLSQVPSLLARRKAEAIPMNDDEVIIGCDTVVIYNSELMGKPRDEEEAIRMLKSLSGTTHEVVSGLCIRTKDKIYTDSVTTHVKFKQLSNEEIEGYVYRSRPLDKAGAYGIQESAGAFVEEIHGDFYNVVGLPLSRLCTILIDEFNISLL